MFVFTLRTHIGLFYCSVRPLAGEQAGGRTDIDLIDLVIAIPGAIFSAHKSQNINSSMFCYRHPKQTMPTFTFTFIFGSMPAKYSHILILLYAVNSSVWKWAQMLSNQRRDTKRAHNSSKYHVKVCSSILTGHSLHVDNFRTTFLDLLFYSTTASGSKIHRGHTTNALRHTTNTFLVFISCFLLTACINATYHSYVSFLHRNNK